MQAKSGKLVGLLLTLGVACGGARAHAAGGPLGIDHEWNYDSSRVWSKSTQSTLEYSLVALELAGALWEGGDTRLGRTFWQSIDSSVAAGITAEVLKRGFSRERPIDGNGPNRWFKGGGSDSFPSGELTLISSVVTPFVLEYGSDHPAVYALEVLPAYAAVARLKTQQHWQTDVLAGFAIGTAWGYYAHSRENPLILSVMPNSIAVGIKRRF